MSTTTTNSPATPLQMGGLLRLALREIRQRIHQGVVAAGFDDLRPSHTTLFRWPGPDGRRPTEVAADLQISKQRVNDLLRELEDRGYLQLDADPSDSRARIIRLTPRGRRLHDAAIAAHAEIEADWARVLGPARYNGLQAALVDIAGAPPPP